ncbi:MAG TPA: VWA domain-containing protein [Bryobacteraceae bacterium]|nr:VWA domain-containing protein [Bryobacteraceae bacterium]
MYRRLLLTCLACAALSLAYAQERLVNLHVVALDRHDQPVANLTADDFQIQDQGKPVRIALMRSNDPKSVSEATPLGPHEFSNHSGSALPSVTVILFDLLHPIDEKLARAQLTKSAANFRTGDQIYLYLLTGRGPFPVRGLPERRMESPATGPLAQDQIDAAFDTAKRLNLDFYGSDMVELTYMSLQGMASRLAGLPGRKSIVWISRGVPLSIASQQPGYSRDYAAQQDQLAATLQRGNIAMYPVGDSRREIGSQSMGMLNDIASRTGGRSHLDMDVGTSIQQAMQDSRASYTLAFSPPVWDAKYHKVRVTCTRSGVRVLAPDGYYPFAAAGVDDEGSQIEAAQWSPFDAGEISLRASISPSAKTPQAVQFAIRIHTDDVQLMSTEAGFSGDVSVTLVAYDAAGRQTVLKQTGYPFRMTAEQHRDALKNGITLSPDQPLKEDVRKIRIIVFDRYSSAIGSLTVPIASADRSPAR